MWSRLDALLSDIGRVCIKVRPSLALFFPLCADHCTDIEQVYTLEKVLQLKRDQITQNTFLEEAIAVRSYSFSRFSRFLRSVEVLTSFR
jgi:hypothetical protein